MKTDNDAGSRWHECRMIRMLIRQVPVKDKGGAYGETLS